MNRCDSDTDSTVWMEEDAYFAPLQLLRPKETPSGVNLYKRCIENGCSKKDPRAPQGGRKETRDPRHDNRHRLRRHAPVEAHAQRLRLPGL